MTAAETGRRGEEVAAEYLRRTGFHIAARNWREGRYELDIVAERRGELHFVEVKSRRAGGLTAPEEAITPQKFRALRHAAAAYMARTGAGGEPHFDLAAVEFDDEGGAALRFVPDAMECSW